MGKLHFFPGEGCLFFKYGHCVYEEILNPGYNRHWQCQVLVKWEKEYDHLVNQAEYFQLNPSQVEGIWERRMARKIISGWNCPHYISCEEEESCIYLHGNICILALPKCMGRCHLYQYNGHKSIIDDLGEE
ncbi:hypothetical protein KFV02_03590 [Desulfohalobiaceae bacterium Ax17]|uniref:hypothetical protein n=1 Tax=Desulfovulcanus ferrireducens TaxID=2831190 RepID=UPI00207B9ECE|nr:hypothetical protein [Desulfovulcanus ferrireducens]MBT8763009.1 hypothetical protein [Desulfovulcanus ferrireducens]